MRCGKCDSCEIERIGCGCDGALDDGCFLCHPEKHLRPPCPGSRRRRTDDCPHCGKSMWMGRDNPRGCQCTIPATTHTHPFLGDVRVLYPGDRPGYLNHVATCKADVEVVLNRRVDLYHFVNGLRFHLRAAEETLAKFDGKFDSDDAQRARRHFGGRDV